MLGGLLATLTGLAILLDSREPVAARVGGAALLALGIAATAGLLRWAKRSGVELARAGGPPVPFAPTEIGLLLLAYALLAAPLYAVAGVVGAFVAPILLLGALAGMRWGRMASSGEELDRILEERVAELEARPYGELVARFVDAEPEVDEIRGPSGTTYQLEIQGFWDSGRRGDLRVMVSGDDGGLRSFAPRTRSLIVRPDGSLVDSR